MHARASSHGCYQARTRVLQVQQTQTSPAPFARFFSCSLSSSNSDRDVSAVRSRMLPHGSSFSSGPS